MRQLQAGCGARVRSSEPDHESPMMSALLDRPASCWSLDGHAGPFALELNTAVRNRPSLSVWHTEEKLQTKPRRRSSLGSRSRRVCVLTKCWRLNRALL